MRKQLLLVGAGIALVGFGNAGKKTIEATPATEAAAETRLAPVATAALVNEPAASPLDDMIKVALAELAPHVKKQSHPAALRTAVEAYYRFKIENPNSVKKPYLYYIDYGLSNSTPRGYVFNMETMDLVEGPFTVAHGRGSGPRNAVPTKFSNRPGSAATSLGLYVTQETYNFSGKSGGRHYTSIGLRMKGESGRFNSNARRRGVVVHGAPYVTPSGSGRSEGCPAMEQSRARRLLPMLANGSVVFQYSPHDSEWLENDPWLRG